VAEVILMAFMPRRDVKPIAKAMMTRLGSLSGVLAPRSADLAKIDGIGETVAAYLRAIAEFQSRAARKETRKRPAISSWSTLMTHVSTQLQHDGRE
jgi:DNA repair protein RadC